MKITIEPTKDFSYPTASVSVPSEELTLSDCFEKLIIPVLLGWGYQEKSINEFFELD